jgi:hypothetical protein
MFFGGAKNLSACGLPQLRDAAGVIAMVVRD